MNHDAAAGRLKRGGGRSFTYDFESVEGEIDASNACHSTVSPEDYFFREWQREVFAVSVDELRRLWLSTNKQIAYEIFEAYDLAEGDRPSYSDLATRHGVSVVTVTNSLRAARCELRKLVQKRLADESLTSPHRNNRPYR